MSTRIVANGHSVSFIGVPPELSSISVVDTQFYGVVVLYTFGLGGVQLVMEQLPSEPSFMIRNFRIAFPGFQEWRLAPRSDSMEIRIPTDEEFKRWPQMRVPRGVVQTADFTRMRGDVFQLFLEMPHRGQDREFWSPPLSADADQSQEWGE